MAVLSFKINGTQINPPLDWEKTQIVATFDYENNQASISTSEIVFVNEAAVFLRDYIAGGITGVTPGIFEGPTLTVDIQDPGLPAPTQYDFVIDTADESFEIIDPTRVKARLKKIQGVQPFQDRANGTTFLLLLDKGAIQPSDFASIPYLTEREPNGIDVALLTTTTILLAIQLANEVRVLSTNIANIVASAGGGATGLGAAAIQAIAIAIIQTIYVALLTYQLVILVKDMIALLISPVKFHKGMHVKTMIEKGCNYLGYQYNTDIAVLEDLYYLPAKSDIDLDGLIEQILANFQVNQPGVGIPAERDTIYTLGDLMTMCNRDLFNARTAIKNNIVEHHALNSNWWQQLSSYQMPDTLRESVKYNASELTSNKLIKFQVDVNDFHTVQNYKGTAFEVITEQNSANDVKNLLFKGLEVSEIGAALGNRKDKLNLVEKTLKGLADMADSVVAFFGGDSGLAQLILNRIGMLVMERDMLHVGKLMRLNAQFKLSANHRDNFGARFLWNNYHNEKSFVLNNFGNQYQVFDGERIIFGYTQFLQLVNNNYLTTTNGDSGKITKFVWNIEEDTAIADFRVKKIFTTNLNERYIEP